MFKVYQPDDEGPEDAQEVDAATPEEAAETYVSNIFGPGYSDSMDVMVIDENGDEYDITVDVDYEPTFYAYGTKVKK